MLVGGGILWALCRISSGCVSTNRPAIPAMPLEPDYQNISRTPIIEKVGDNFTVSDEFVLRATQEHQHIKRVKVWKTDNSIP